MSVDIAGQYGYSSSLMSPNQPRLPEQGMMRALRADAVAVLSGLAILATGAVAPSIASADVGPGHEGPFAAAATLSPGGAAPTSGSSHHRRHARGHRVETPIWGPGGAAGPESTGPSISTSGSETSTDGNGGTADSDPGGVAPVN
jgi:hypothetical protein